MFEQHLQFLVDHHFTAISLATLADGLKNPFRLPAKPVILTMDDGHNSVFKFAVPLLQQYNCPAELFIITDRVDTTGFLNWRQLRVLSEQGLGLQSHGKSHTIFNKLTISERKVELTESRMIIENMSGQSVSTFAVPIGGYPRGLRHQLAESGYELCCTSYHGLNTVESEPFALRRIMIKYPYDTIAGLKSLMRPFSLLSVTRHVKNMYKYTRNSILG